MESNRKLDRVSMWHSIEARSPFQDERIIAFANQKLRNPTKRDLQKRLILENFPEIRKLGIREDKAGFISPVGHWLRGNSKLVTTTIRNLEDHEIVNKGSLNYLADAPARGDYREIMQLWSLVVFSKWLSLREST